jgi:hypothetical protein
MYRIAPDKTKCEPLFMQIAETIRALINDENDKEEESGDE